MILRLLVLVDHLFVYTAPEKQFLHTSTTTCATDYRDTGQWIEVAEALEHGPMARLL